MNGIPWSQKDIEKLKHMYSTDWPLEDISKALGRSKQCILQKASCLRLKRSPSYLYRVKGGKLSEAQFDRVALLFKAGVEAKAISETTGLRLNYVKTAVKLLAKGSC